MQLLFFMIIILITNWAHSGYYAGLEIGWQPPGNLHPRGEKKKHVFPNRLANGWLEVAGSCQVKLVANYRQLLQPATDQRNHREVFGVAPSL